MAKQIKTKRLAWADHLERIYSNLPARKVYFSNQAGDRRRGGPFVKCIELVNEDVKKRGITNWKHMTQNMTK